MIKYRLENQEKQRRLDYLSNGDFSKRLQEYRFYREDVSCIHFGNLVEYKNGKEHREFIVRISPDEIEEIKEESSEYNPHAWNNYPEVTPPEGVLMRCETYHLGVWNYYGGVFWKGGWRDEHSLDRNYDEGYIGEPWGRDVYRFRPWNEE